MVESFDFERYWLQKFTKCLKDNIDNELVSKILEGNEDLNSQANTEDVIDWTQKAVQLMDENLDEITRRKIMLGCACHYPEENLLKIKEAYKKTGDISIAHCLLQEQFEAFLQNTLNLPDKMIEEIVGKGWGAAGILKEDSIIATKIPKSGNLLDYMQEKDPARKRKLYCHCPRIRDILKTGKTLSTTYCYCGAGFYKAMWEFILDEEVHIELLESVLKGDDVCKIVIYLPK